MRLRHRRGWLAALAISPLLSGCVAAVAIPLVAGGTLYARNHRVRAATTVDQAALYTGPVQPPRTAYGEEPARVTVTNLTELPPPTPSDLAGKQDPWQPFFDYALAQAAALKDAEQPQSALIVPDGLFVSPQRRPCTQRYPAVILDLDKAKDAFTPAPAAHAQAGLAQAGLAQAGLAQAGLAQAGLAQAGLAQAGLAQAGLAQGLARLREAGTVVLWLTRLPAGQVGAVANALRTSGLDPEGKDQFLLIRGPEDRKQVLREQANQDVCVVAIAGDERSDFDELFDYLRNPDSAAGLDAMLGSGWFLVPPPLEAPAP